MPRSAAALAVAATLAAVGTGCAAPAASGGPIPSVAPKTTAAAEPTASATPALARDLTAPGAAKALVADLMRAADALQAIMVTVTPSDAAVTVLREGQAQTWAWRDNRIQRVPSDITYVDQHMFDPDDYDFSDLGALFRAAESVSGSRRGQSLQIVDYSAGLVSMSVSTVPESRAVFFNPDGTLLPTLDFTSEWGLQHGYSDAVAGRRLASAMGFGSELGVQLDGLQAEDGSFQRRQRTARTPVIVTTRVDTTLLRPFDSALVDPAGVWRVLSDLHEQGAFGLDQPWSCIVDDRAATGVPTMHFTVGDRSFTTDLSGNVIP